MLQLTALRGSGTLKPKAAHFPGLPRCDCGHSGVPCLHLCPAVIPCFSIFTHNMMQEHCEFIWENASLPLRSILSLHRKFEEFLFFFFSLSTCFIWGLWKLKDGSEMSQKLARWIIWLVSNLFLTSYNFRFVTLFIIYERHLNRGHGYHGDLFPWWPWYTHVGFIVQLRWHFLLTTTPKKHHETSWKPYGWKIVWRIFFAYCTLHTKMYAVCLVDNTWGQ